MNDSTQNKSGDTANQDFANLNFEDALKRLEEIVRKLESGDVPLDQSIALYEQGEKLRGLCQKRLEDAQAKIERITLDRNGKAQGTAAFDAD
ncbi:exodeoxyribonuclease VII small subunit [Parasphingorhabdus sp. JC815]|uniref:exodeoxyribonuclease VII small subunit n=1 Tax=Parasphingorhabdus sp. JC815 TaxID=3232140 RepID=UPI0034576679